MFSPSLGRVVRSTGTIPTPAVCTFGRVASAQQTLARPTGHQRRLSSSKPSVPPHGSKGPSSAQQSQAAGASRTTSSKKKRSTAPAAPTMNVPHVPPTNHFENPQVKLSSFFSLHRPISVTSEIPPVATPESFDSIFQSRTSHNRRAMMENIETLSGSIESLEAALRAQGQKVPGDVTEDIHHLDGPPKVSIDDLIAKFVPFNPPPAPVPIEQSGEARATPKDQEKVPVAPVTQRSWSTEVVVTVSVDASGNRTYSTSTSPMVEVSVPAAENSQEMDDVQIRQPFLERMKRRQNTSTRYRDIEKRPDMLAISVKRQRKLKMKKHKYKKLMKRTRLLRRKLDRL